tara:strand:- start:744 stop:1073 length:330 start_codon:yes stop_codon:yes gene_type:complete
VADLAIQTSVSARLLLIGAALYTNTTYTQANRKDRMILSPAHNRVGGEHRGPLNASAGGGSKATANIAPEETRKGRSLSALGLVDRMNDAIVMIVMHVWYIILLQKPCS